MRRLVRHSQALKVLTIAAVVAAGLVLMATEASAESEMTFQAVRIGRTDVLVATDASVMTEMFAYEAEVDPSGTTAVIHRRYDNGDLRGFLMRYSSEMGVSPGLIAAAEHVSSDELKILSRAEIRRWHLGVAR